MIKLLKKYPYDNSYDYVKLFDTKKKQIDFFNTFKSIIVENEGSYDGYIKDGESFIVNYSHEYLVNENVNYLIYNNGYKDMFCFITDKEYIDEENTRLYYSIDVMNTFCFDFTLKKSFVERKVCTMDEVSDYDEGIDIGEHIITENHKCFDKEYTFFSMWKGFTQQVPTFKENGSLENVVSFPFMNFKPFCHIDGVEYPVFFSPMQSVYSSPIFEGEIEVDVGTGETGEIVGYGELPIITNSVGTYMVPAVGTCTAGFPYYNSGGAHSGVDIANAEGTPIYADMDGVCTIADQGNVSYGKYVKIKHDNGTTSYMCHMSKQLVTTGQRVKQGDMIGLMGSTGKSTGNHVHWEIRNVNNTAIHPCPLLKTGKIVTKEGIK